MTYWNNGKILTGNVPYHHLSRGEQVLYAILKGVPPKRFDEAVVTDHRWRFIKWRWSPAKSIKPRPPSDEIVEFTEDGLAEIMTTEGLAKRTATMVM